jgi:uncharacterized repeat protein (TIGR01451 family)/fimbrial isopeptide formation D2 family protein
MKKSSRLNRSLSGIVLLLTALLFATTALSVRAHDNDDPTPVPTTATATTTTPSPTTTTPSPTPDPSGTPEPTQPPTAEPQPQAAPQPPAPTAGFNVSREEGDAPLTIAVGDASTNAYTWAWDFGDGGTATGAGPHEHTYRAEGTYTITLNVTGAGGSASASRQVIVYPPAAPDLSAAIAVQSSSGLEACLRAVTTGDVAAYAWRFGDGATGSDAAPCHTYAGAGRYTVQLVVTGADGATVSAARTLAVGLGNDAPIAQFSAQPSDPYAGESVGFYDSSIGVIDTWAWDFGDGGSSNERNPDHAYASVGSYSVTLTVAGPGGSSQTTQTVNVTDGSRLTCWIGGDHQLISGQSYSYSANANQPISSYAWTLDGEPRSSENSFSVTLTELRDHIIGLTVTTEDGRSCSSEKWVAVHEGSIPTQEASLTALASPTSGAAPLRVNFSADAENVYSFEWQFPAGSRAFTRDTSYVFTTPGEYTVTLVGGTAEGNLTSQVVIRVTDSSGFNVGFTASRWNALAPATICFYDRSSVGARNWAWNFGDGATTNEQNPCHNYASAGSYNVTLAAEDADGVRLSATNTVRLFNTVEEMNSTPNDPNAPPVGTTQALSAPNAYQAQDGGIDVSDPALSKIGVLFPGDTGLVGEQLTWEVTVTNNGVVDETGVVVTDSIRNDMRIDAVRTEQGSISAAGQVVTATIGTLTPSQSVRFFIDVTVLASPNNGLLTNTAVSNAGTTASASVSVPSAPANYPNPNVALGGLPIDVFAGGQTCFTATFTNTGTPGYGPYMQLVVPPYVTFNSATFLGSPVILTDVGVFGASGVLIDPISNASVFGTAGSHFYILKLPIGSVVTGNPPLITTVCVTTDPLSPLGVPLPINITPAYEFGATPTGEGGSIVDPAPTTGTITPILVTFNKVDTTPEGERPPGPTWTYDYILTAELAAGQTLTNVVFRDVMPNMPTELVFDFQEGSTVISGSCARTGAAITEPTVGNGQVFTVTFTSMTETTSTSTCTLVVTYSGYILDILSEAGGNDVDPVVNNASFDGDHPNRPAATAPLTDSTTVSAENDVFQKSASPASVVPGDTVDYSVVFQITDYGDVNEVVITDTMPDGIDYIPASASVAIPGYTGAITPRLTYNANGTLTLVYCLLGTASDCARTSGIFARGSSGTLTYQGDVLQNYRFDGDPVRASDSLPNSVIGDFTLTDGADYQNTSAASVSVPPVSIAKQTITTPRNNVGFVHGETVRFRLTVQIPSGDTRDIIVEDFFPLPVFDVDNPDFGLPSGTPSGMPFLATTGLCSTYPTAAFPTYEQCGIYFGPGNTLPSATPLSVTLNNSTNAVRIAMPDVQTTTPQTLVLDIVIAVVDQPFADGLFLSNQARLTVANTPGATLNRDAISFLDLSAPLLTTVKGVSATSGNGAIAPIGTPVNGNLSNADAGDTVTYVITTENIGGARAYNVVITDPPPAGLTACTIDSVRDGTNVPYAYTGNLTSGIALTSYIPGNPGNVAANRPQATILVTVTCTLGNNVSPAQVIINTATVNYKPLDTPTSGSYPPVSDTAQVEINDPTIDKTVTPATATIGEVVRYTITATVPEGEIDALSIVDTLPVGMAYVDCISITADAGLASSRGAFTCANLAPTAAAISGEPARLITLDLGDVTTTTASATASKTITFVFDAVITDVGTNTRGTVRTNDVDLNWTANSVTSSVTDDTPPSVTITEPTLTISKTATPTTGDAGDTINFDIVIAHTAASNANAYDLRLEDVLPADVTCVSVTHTAGTAPTSNSGCAATIVVTWDVLPDNGTTTIRIAATLNADVDSAQVITNVANLTDYDTRPADSASDLSPFHPGPEDRERSYTGTDDAIVTVNSPTISKSRTGTSEAHTSGANVAIGETVTYEIRIPVPEGITNGLQIVDTLDTGLVFRDLRLSAGYASITFPLGVTSSVVLPSTILDNAHASVTTAGRVATFNLGTITNINNSAASEEIVITYQVVVADTGNPRGGNRNNSAVLSFTRGNPPGGTATLAAVSATNVTIVEPTLTVDKTASPTTGDAGDEITFTLVVAHSAASNEDAFDVVLTDVIPTGLTYVPGSLVNVSGVAATLNDSGAPTLTASWSALTESPDQTSTIRFRATINSNVAGGAVITNTASLAYDSLPADGNHPADEEDLDSPYVTTDGERDYTASDTADVTIVAPSFVKAITATSFADTGTARLNPANEDVAIGETVTFTMTITIPEGVTSISISDPLPNAMSVVSSRVVSIGANLSGSSLATGDSGSVAGSTVTFNFGTITNTPDGVSNAADQIVVEIAARLTDDAANSNGQTKTNTATVTYGAGSTTASAEFDVVEPVLAIVKAFASPTITAGGAGSSFTITLSNTGNADAHEVALTDTINALLNVSTITLNLAGAPNTTLLTDNSNSGTPADVDMTFDRLNRGESIVVTVTYSVAASAAVQTVNNTASTTYDDLPSGHPDNAFDRNSSASSPTSVNIVRLIDLALTKTVSDSSIYAGDTITYTLTSINNGPSDASNVQIIDTLPVGVAFVSSSPTSPTCTYVSGTRTLTCNLGTLAPTASTVVTITATVNTGYDGTVQTNNARTQAAESGVSYANETNATNNTATAPINVRAFSTVGDRVWHDIDADGTQDAGEIGLAGLTVTLTGTDEDGVAVSRTTTTAANGIYSFANLKAANGGGYTVTVTPIAGMVITDDDFPTDTTEDSTTTLAVTFNETISTVDFGYRGSSSIGDRVWDDRNGDGVQDAGEPGISGLTVTLTGTDALGNALTVTTTTGTDGAYTFINLLAGSYTVTVTPPAGMSNTYDSGTGNNHNTPVTLGATETRTDVDFGYRGTSSIGDRVWHDRDGGADQDAGEPGLPGLTVTLTGTDTFGNALSLSTTTGANGIYGFANLAPANASGYTITVTTPPAGTTPTFDRDGSVVGASANTATGMTLGAGAAPTDVDFGYRATGSISGAIWRDDDGGATDNSEPQLAGLTVTLTGTDAYGNAVSLTTTTDAAGAYSFANLLDGSYTVTVAPPAGMTNTYDGNTGNNHDTPVTLAAGENRTGVDFGYRGTASLGDRVWDDRDGDGVQDGDEPGISGVTVTLTGTDTFGSAVSFSTTTGTDGAYTFANLPPSNGAGYSVTVTPPSGMSPTYDLNGVGTPNTTTASLGAGATRTDVDFGYRGTGSIGDRVWADRDGDGVQDVGESGLSGLTVTLTGTDLFGNSVSLTTTTAVNGIYGFANLAPSNIGGYTVTITTPPAGTTATYDLDGFVTAHTAVANLSAGQARTDVDYGYQGTGSITGAIWRDDDGSATDNSEPQLAGLTVTLTGTDAFGNLINLTTTTDSAGAYLFDNLFGGSYTVTVTPPAGMTNTYDSNTGNNHDTPVTLAAGEDRTGIDFGYRGTASLGDRVWEDRDADGTQDLGEPGLPGLTVTLTGVDTFGAAVNVTTTTGINGAYTFANLPPSSVAGYTVTVTPPAGTTQTYDLDGIGTANSAVASLSAGQTRTDVDFGYQGNGSIAGVIWRDDDNSATDNSEPQLAGLTVTLTGTDAYGNTVLRLTTTDSAGAYLFDNLLDGSYTVTVTPPAGMTNTFDGNTGNNHDTPVTLAAGEDRTGIDFGYRGTASIGDRVWEDRDGDTAQDAGEPGISGLTITLTGTDTFGAAVSFSTTTGANGIYTFANLPPSDATGYTVTITTPPAGTTPTFDRDGSVAGASAHVANGMTLAAGAARTDVDFGYRGTGSIGDRVWQDTDNDTLQDGFEPGLVGLTVTLTGTDAFGNTVSLSTTTGANGLYSFDNLLASDATGYTVTVTPPPLGYAPNYDLGEDNDPLTAPTTPNIHTAALAAGQTRTDFDYGYRGTQSVSGSIWRDDDGSATQNGTEPNLAGIPVTLTDGGGNTIATTTTATDGSYSFANVPPGAFTVVVTTPAGMTNTFDGGTGNNSDTPITVTAGSNVTDIDFGYRGTASLGDRIWHDRDGDGVQDVGEPGLPGLTVTLSGTDAFGAAVSITTTTGANGIYGFANLPPSNGAGYVVTVNTPPAGTNAVYDLDGTGTPNSTTEVLTAGEAQADVDFGYQGTGSITGAIWRDDDGNAVDNSEPPLANITVTLTGTDAFGNAISFTTTTDSVGVYLFDNLLAGSYIVTVTPPVGTINTYDSGTGNNSDTPVTLAAGENRTGVDFGYRGVYTVGDRVWDDRSGDGVQDAGEPGISGLTVTMTGTDAFGDPVNVTTITGANGAYSFPDIPPSDAAGYTVTVTAPAGVAATYDLDGIGTLNTTQVVVTTTDRLDVDFGYRGTGSIGDRVWRDENGNGVQEGGEAGVNGVTVTLTGTDVFGNSVSRTITTTGDGDYTFDSLMAGSYTVVISNTPIDLGASYDLDGGNDNRAAVPLTAGQTRTDADFGLAPFGSVGDRVWQDLNRNGVQDPGEEGIAGVTLRLTGTNILGNTVNLTAITDANGNYLFDNLLQGSYTIAVDESVFPPRDQYYFQRTYDRDGNLDMVVDFVIVPGQDIRDMDFGYIWEPVVNIAPTPAPIVETPTDPAPAATIDECAVGCVDWQMFHSDRTGDWDIFRLNSDGTQVNLTQHSADDIAPSRSPNGGWIAFSSNRDGNWEIYVAASDGDASKTQRVTYNNVAMDTDPVWGPNDTLVYESTRDGNWELYAFNVVTGAETRLTDISASDLNAYWSPQGSHVLFQSDRDGAWQLYRLDLATLAVTRLSDGSGDDFDAAYNDDGTQIVFRSTRGGSSALYLMNAGGGNVRRISDENANATNAVWSPDGSLIAYQSDLDGDLDIYVYQVATDTTRQLTDNEIADYAPSWRCGTLEVLFTSDIMGNADIFQAPALSIDAPPLDVADDALQLTTDRASDVYPEDTPTEENASLEGHLPGMTQAAAQTRFIEPDLSLTPRDISLPRGEWVAIRGCE